MQQYQDLLRQSLLKFAPLADEEIQSVVACFTERKVRKSEVFLQAGNVCSKVFFVARGLVRSFHLNPNGSEFTRLFVKEGGFCTVLISFNEHLKSPASFQAVEDSVLLEISETDFRKMTGASARLQAIYLRILEDYQNFQIRRIEFLTQYSPEEKIRAFHAENPDLSGRLSKKLIATYLQITPETYSRYQKRMS